MRKERKKRLYYGKAKAKEPTKPMKCWKEKTKKSNFTKKESNVSFRDFEIEFSSFQYKKKERKKLKGWYMKYHE